METTIITFEITSSFEDWAKSYDASLHLQREFGIASLFRGRKKDDSTKCVVVVSAKQGALDKFMASNSELIEASGHVLESTDLATYLS